MHLWTHASVDPCICVPIRQCTHVLQVAKQGMKHTMTQPVTEEMAALLKRQQLQQAQQPKMATLTAGAHGTQQVQVTQGGQVTRVSVIDRPL